MDPDPGGANTLYSYVDITATGTEIISNTDDVAVLQNFPAGETFFMHGTEHTGFYVNSNGFITSTAGSDGDFTNDCNLPASPDVGSGDRIYALHDDLTTSVYYQYFPTGAGPTGWTGNVSVIQWVGNYTGFASQVDFELLIFHHLDVALLMVEVDDDAGGFSTTGMQNDGASTGLNLYCNSAGSIVPGQTLVGFGSLRLNEIRVDETVAGDANEYFEISGVPGWDASNIDLVVVGDGASGSGEVDEVVSLNGGIVDPNGVGAVFMSVGTSAFNIPNEQVDYNAIGDALNFEDSDNLTFFLVEGSTATVGQDLDTNDDGNLDVLPWTSIIDNVALIQTANPPAVAGDEWWYGGISVGPDGANATALAFRCDDVHGAWRVGDRDTANDEDTPGRLNACQDCGNGIVEGTEECDGDGAGTGGETALCNDDCRLSQCGDGNQNASAGEGCDDGDNDNTDDCPDGLGGTCQPAACGDGFVDVEGADTEGCDDGDGDNTDDCPDGVGGTCEPATCGDSFVDMEGGTQEDCDDGVETTTCDADCTDVVCGDGTINSTAGETCEDGNQTNGDDCPDDGANGGTCISATCGDGFVDQEGGTMEDCDGDGAGNPGETADCDTDCTDQLCGDGVINATANEDCDDTAESISCDADCTDVVCGDGELNVTAGEACDDGNTTPGDGCDANCAIEMGMGGMGGMGAGGMGTGGMGTGGMATGGMGTGATGGSTTSGGNDDDGGTRAEESGCGCSTPGKRAPIGAPMALLLGLGLLVSRRRRR